MSQILLPPPSQPEPWVAAPAAEAAPAPAPAASVAVLAPAGPSYAPPPPPPPSRFWRAVKWPVRKVIKLIYVIGSAAKHHRIMAVTALTLLLAMGGGGFAVYHFTHPSTSVGSVTGNQSAQGALGGGANLPFTITSTGQPPISPAVVEFLRGWKTSNAHEVTDAISPAATLQSAILQVQPQSSMSQADWQSRMDALKTSGFFFQQFIYTGGYLLPDGTANYTIEVVIGQNGSPQIGLLTWYFTVNTNGQIATWQDLTPAN